MYYMAASQYEGCGHKHRSLRAAMKCVPKIERRPYSRIDVYRIHNNKWAAMHVANNK